jgi:hypothetical protein
MLQIVPESKAFGPCRRERSYQAGNTIVTETYYVYVIYGMLKDKLIKIDFECGTSFFSFNENNTIIPKNMIKEIFNINGHDSDLHINKNSVYTIDKGAVFKSKDFANKVLAKAQSLGYKVLLIKPWAGGGGDLDTTNDVIDQIGARFGCCVVGPFKTTESKYHYYPDLSGMNTLHYNDLGYAWFATALPHYVAKAENDQLKYIIPS